MRIGYDVSQTGRGRAGCGYFAHSLVTHLAAVDAANDYVLYPTFGDFYWDPDAAAATTRIDRPNFRRGPTQASWEAARSFWRHPAPDWEDPLGRPDIVHSNNFFCPTALRRARLVYTLYDLSFLEHPEHTQEKNRLGCFEGVFAASLHADHILAISRYSRRHFLEVFPHYPADRVSVVHLASRYAGSPDVPRPPQEALAALEPGRFWVSVGTLEPRKNHRRLLRAYARLKARLGRTYPLVLAGGRGWLLDDLEPTIDELGLGGDVVLTGYAPEDVVVWLYQNCFACLYPSLFEGFGLPVVEAMSLGAPVVTSNATSLPEVVGEAGLLVDPLSEQSIERAMADLVDNAGLRERLKRQARQQAGKFTWEGAARAVLGCYEEVLKRPRFAAGAAGGGVPVSAAA